MIILIPQSFSESSSILGVLLRSRPLQQTWGRWSVLSRSTMSQCLPQSNSCWNFANRGLAVAPKTEPAPAYRYCVAVTAQNQLASQFQVKRACHRLSGCPIVPFCSPKTELLQYVRSSSDRLLRRLLYSRFCFGLSFHISERSFFVIFAQSRTTYIYMYFVYIIDPPLRTRSTTNHEQGAWAALCLSWKSPSISKEWVHYMVQVHFASAFSQRLRKSCSCEWILRRRNVSAFKSQETSWKVAELAEIKDPWNAGEYKGLGARVLRAL